MPKISLSWGYFNKIDKLNAQCKTCGAILKTTGGQTTGMRYHMKIRHPEVLLYAQDYELLGSSTSNSNSPSMQRNLKQWDGIGNTYQSVLPPEEEDFGQYSSPKHSRESDPLGRVKSEDHQSNHQRFVGQHRKRMRGRGIIATGSSGSRVKVESSVDDLFRPDIAYGPDVGTEEVDGSGSSIDQTDLIYYPEQLQFDDAETPNSNMEEDLEEEEEQENDGSQDPEDSDPQSRFQLKIIRDLMKFFCQGDTPISSAYTVDFSGFENTITFLEPKIDRRAMIAFAKQRDNSLFESVKSSLASNFERELRHVTGVAFTATLWTGSDDLPIQSLTIHFISRGFRLKKHFAGWTPFYGSTQAGTPVKANLDGLVNFLDLNVDTHRWCVNDHTSNIVLTVSNQINTEFHCCAHKINELVENSIRKTPALNELIVKCSELGRHLYKSVTARKFVIEKCANLGVQYRHLIQPIAQTWSNHLQQMTDVIEMKSALQESSEKLQEFLPSPEEFSTLDRCATLLQKFDKMSWILSANGPTMQHVIVQVYNTSQSLKNLDDPEASVARELAGHLLEGLEHHFPNFGVDISEHCIAHMLDPVYKGVLLHKLNRFQETKTLLLSMETGNGSIGDDNSLDNQEEEEPSYSEVVLRDYLANAPPNKLSELAEELECYLRAKPSDKSVDILGWWRSKESWYPRLALMARKYLCVPATSVKRD